MVEDGLREYIPAVRQVVLDTIAAGGKLLTGAIPFHKYSSRLEKSFILMSVFLFISIC